MKAVTELLDLSGKAAIVTGGAAGIGLGITRRLAEARRMGDPDEIGKVVLFLASDMASSSPRTWRPT